MRNGSTRLGSINFHNAKIGAGGWTTGIVFAADGTKMVRTDTFNAYVCAPGTTEEWVRELKPAINCNAAHIDIFYGGNPHPWGQLGTYDVAIAPSNSSVRYLVCMGRVWVTQDDGVTWTRTALAEKAYCFPNERFRMSGKPLAVDPQNPAICYFGAPDGVHYTLDYGANWTSISTGTIPTPTSVGADRRRYVIAFDPTSSVVSSKKQGIYIFSNGNGLYRSTDGGTSFSAVSGSPTVASHMKIGSSGRVHIAGDGGNGSGQYRRWDPSGPTWIAPSGVTAKTIAISPHNANHIYRCQAGGGLDVSTDDGVTWALGGNNGTTNSRVATSIEWQEYTNENYMSNGDIEFDPIENRIWCAEGVGVWYTDEPPTTYSFGNSTVWVEYSPGIENMVSTLGTVAEDGTFGYACHDRGMFVIPKAEVGIRFPSIHGVDNGFQHGGMVAFAPGNSSFVVGTSFLGSRATAYSTNRGVSWTRLDTLTAESGGAGGGNIVVFDEDNWLQVQTNNDQTGGLANWTEKNGIWRTEDRGATWELCPIGNGQVFFHAVYNFSRRILVRDDYATGTAYAYNVGIGSVGTQEGIWKTTNYGVSWTRIHTGYIISFGADYYHGKFTQVGPNDWVWCGGDEALGLWRSTDGMVTWSQITGTDDVNGSASFGEVFGFGVGKAAYGSDYKTLFAAGWRMVSPTGASSSTGYGFWMSFDNGANWSLVAQYPDGIFDIVNDIVGDPSTFGRFFIAWGGSGVSMYNYDYKMRIT